jgi:hypothetical protein
MSGKRSDSDRTLLCPRLTVQLDALDLVQGLGGQIALAAMGTTDDGHVLDDEEVGPLTVTTRDAPHVGAALTTNKAYHSLGRMVWPDLSQTTCVRIMPLFLPARRKILPPNALKTDF